MKDLGPSSEAEMILAFLRAEVHSPRFARYYFGPYDAFRNEALALVNNADLGDALQNEERRAILDKVRGYVRKIFLFPDFPSDVKWRRVQLERGDSPRLLYANLTEWVKLSKGSRRVVEGAKKATANPNVLAVAKRIRRGDTFEPLIAVDGDTDSLVLVEGHVRATAYLAEGKLEGAIAIVGSSLSMRNWGRY
jgi:hypothetical protein